MDKKSIRERILEKRAQMSEKELFEKSMIIAEKLFELDEYKDAKRIMSFVSNGTEVHTHDIITSSINAGKSVTVPYTIHNPREMIASEIFDFAELEIGYYNILSPRKEFHRFVEPGTLDLILVPGVGISLEGYRVGYGGGYYDRFLDQIRKDTKKIALIYDMQIVDQVPIEDFDIPVDMIITEKRIIYCR